MNDKDREAFNKIKDIVEKSIKFNCGFDCSKMVCNCYNRQIFDIVKEKINEI